MFNVKSFFLHLSTLWDVCCQNTITELPTDVLVCRMLWIFIVSLQDNESTRQQVKIRCLLVSIPTSIIQLLTLLPLHLYSLSILLTLSQLHSITSSLKKTHQCVFIFIGIIDTSLHHFITPLHPLSLYTFPDIINNLK